MGVGPPAASAMSASAMGKYRVLAELGRGGMASVVLAAAVGPDGFNKLVVLKQLLPCFADDPKSRRAFREEAKLAARLNHPNVVQTYEVSQRGDNDVIVMEYLEGQSLSSLVIRSYEGEPARLTMPLATHLRIIADALEGLHHAHELADYDGTPLNLVHRDVAPHNIMVTYEGQVKLLDFGIAKAATSSTQTEEGVLKGRIAYMAPEQVLGEPLDRRADIFAMGAILWEPAARSRLWSDVADVTILQRVANGDIPSPRSVNPDVDPELERIVMKALALDPADRYATAEEMRADLESFAQTLGPRESPRAMGAVVASLFREERRAMRATIGAKLGQLGGPPLSDGEVAPAIGAGASGVSSTTHSYSFPSILAPRASSRRAPRVLLTALAAAALLGAAGVLAWTWLAGRAPPRLAETGATPAPAKQREPAPAPAASARTIALRVSVTPAEARLFLDGEPLPNPVSRVVPADMRSHTVRAEARGYQTKVVDVIFADNISLYLTIEKEQAPSPAPPPAQGQRPRKKAAPASQAPTAQVASCDQPFYIDARGIKTLRPECR